MHFEGRVIKKQVSRGSKSQRDAVVLATDAGEYVLRRRGGNPFRDSVLEELIGKSICCDGRLEDYALILSDWTVTDPAG